MPDNLSPRAQNVQDALSARGFSFQVTELSASTRTAHDAAHAIGCAVSQIAKSIIFRGEETGAPVLAIVSGSNRVAPSKLANLTGEPLKKADADFVRERTGFAIGGVPRSVTPSPCEPSLTRTCCCTTPFGQQPGPRMPCSSYGRRTSP